MKKIKTILRSYLKKRKIREFKSCGDNLTIDFKSSSFSLSSIEIGENVFIGSRAYFAGNISIGNNIMFGPNVTILDGDHLFGVIGESVRFLKPILNENSKKVTIEDEVWCGASAIILKGVTLGMGSVIGAGSIVSKDIPPFTIAVGNPCKPVKLIFTDEELRRHLYILGRTYEFIDKIITQRKNILKSYGIIELEYYELSRSNKNS